MSKIILPKNFNINVNRKQRPDKFNQKAINHLVKECAFLISEMHPSYSWTITCSADCSMIHVQSPEMGTRWGFSIYTKEIQQHDNKKRLLGNAAGEMFERFHLDSRKRKRFSGLRDLHNNPIPIN